MPRACDFVKCSLLCWEAERPEAFYSGDKVRLQCLSVPFNALQCSFRRMRNEECVFKTTILRRGACERLHEKHTKKKERIYVLGSLCYLFIHKPSSSANPAHGITRKNDARSILKVVASSQIQQPYVKTCPRQIQVTCLHAT